MKKAACLVSVLFLSVGIVFADTEIWTRMGLQTGYEFESAPTGITTTESYMSSIGINLNAYQFWNKSNIGLFVDDGFLFPQTLKSTEDGVTSEHDLSVYDFFMQVSMTIGPAFRYDISEKFKFFCGIGLHFIQTTGTIEDYLYSYSLISWAFGVGGDVGVKFDVSDSFYISSGAAFSYDFACYTDVTTSFGSGSGWAEDGYKMVSVYPYICLGINLYKGTSKNSVEA